MWVIDEIVGNATDLVTNSGRPPLGFPAVSYSARLCGLADRCAATFMVSWPGNHMGFGLSQTIISAMIGIVAVSYLIEIFLVKPEPMRRS